MNKKQLFITAFFLLAVSTYSFSQTTGGLQGVVNGQVTELKAVAKAVAIVGIILGIISAAIVIMFDFKDNQTLRKVLIAIAVGIALLASIGGVISLLNGTSW